MHKQLILKIIITGIVLTTIGHKTAGSGGNRLKDSNLEILLQLCNALSDRQIVDEMDGNYGALVDSANDVFCKRSGESVLPFAVAYKYSGENKYGIAAVRLANWLFRQQADDGSWSETPEASIKNTSQQLLTLIHSYPILIALLSKDTVMLWKISMKKAADYLTLNPEQCFLHINEYATTAAALAAAYRILPDTAYKSKAEELARTVAWNINKEGFIVGEGNARDGQSWGVDLGYNIDMSLWALGLYAKAFNDEAVKDAVIKSLAAHQYFIYPDGSFDNSWGVHSYEWATFGNLGAAGCQASFGLFSAEDKRFNTAAILNLEYLSKMITDGIVNYGPMYRTLFDQQPSIYPTIARAVNLALAIEHGDHTTNVMPALPCEIMNWYKHFKTLDVVLIRSQHYMATISAYHDIAALTNGEESLCRHHPTGGSVCNLWSEDIGYLQSSSQTNYCKWDSLFPDPDHIHLPLTPRIETYTGKDYYTNLYEFSSKISVRRVKNAIAKVAVAGRLKNFKRETVGVTYRWTHRFETDAIQKQVLLDYSDKKVGVQIVEPFVYWPETKIYQQDKNTVVIKNPNATWKLKLIKGKAKFILGKEAERYCWPIPGMRCYPVILQIKKHKNERKMIEYRLERELILGESW